MNNDYKYFEKHGGVFNCFIENYNLNLDINFKKLMNILGKHYVFFDIKPHESNSFFKYSELPLEQDIKEYYNIRFKTFRVENGELVFDYIYKNENMTISFNFSNYSNHKFTSLTFYTHPVVNCFKFIELDENGDERVLEEDQTEAAKLNRKIMTEFLHDLDENYGSIIEFGGESGAINPKFWFKFGVKEDAEQINF